MKKNKILKVLEKTPSSTKLYSATFGKLEFNGIVASVDGLKIELITKNQECTTYFPDGRYRKKGEVTLYPSKEMRNWDKFAWKKGDVLVNNEGTFCIFKEFSSYPYTTFIATFVNNIENLITGSIIKVTHDWHKAPSEDAEKYIEYVNANLKKVSRRLNIETLEVEKIKFKDGDILYGEKDTIHTSVIFILKTDKEKIKYYACLPLEYSMKCYYDCTSFIGNKTIRYAEAEEIEKLFNALAKEGKRWNAEKKVIEDIKPTYKKKVIRRNTNSSLLKKSQFEIRKLINGLQTYTDLKERQVDITICVQVDCVCIAFLTKETSISQVQQMIQKIN